MVHLKKKQNNYHKKKTTKKHNLLPIYEYKELSIKSPYPARRGFSIKTTELNILRI